MTHDLWASENDSNDFLRDSLGPVFEERKAGALRTDRYGCTRWAGFVCLYTSLPTVGCSSLDLLRAYDMDEFNTICTSEADDWRGRRRQAMGFVAVPEKMDAEAWVARYGPPTGDGERSSNARLRDAILTRGLALGDGAVAISASHTAWDNDGVTEAAILARMELTVESARALVQKFKANRHPDPFWRETQ